jgi:hypothetical protein
MKYLAYNLHSFSKKSLGVPVGFDSFCIIHSCRFIPPPGKTKKITAKTMVNRSLRNLSYVIIQM